MRLRPLVLAWAAAFLLNACSQPEEEQASPIPVNALQSLSGPAANRAEAALERLRAQPGNADAHGQAGMLLHAYDQLAGAESLYQRAHALDPGALRWSYYLGLIRSAQGRPEEAAKDLERALRAAPDFAPAQKRLADALLEIGRPDQAAQLYRKVLEGDQDDPEALLGLGRAHLQRDRPQDAVEPLSRAVAIAPTYGAAHYQLALAYRDDAGAAEDSRRHMELYQQHRDQGPPSDDPLLAQIRSLRNDPTERIRRATELSRQNRLEEAAAELQLALEDDPALVQAHINLLIVYGRLGRLEEAERHYRQALELNPERAELHYNYGVLVFQADRLKEAEQAFEEALEANPHHAAALNNLGQIREGQRRFPEAERLYRRAVEARPGYRLAHFHLGRLLLNTKRAIEAIQQLEQTVEPVDAETPLYLYGLASAYALSGDRQTALRHGREAQRLARQFGQDDLLAAIKRDLAALE